MKGYESIPSTADEEMSAFKSSSSTSFAADSNRRRRSPALVKWTILTIGLLVLLAVSFQSSEKVGTAASLRSASFGLVPSPTQERVYPGNVHVELATYHHQPASAVVLPDPPAQPEPPKDKIYNHNPHVKLLAYHHQKVNHFQNDNEKAEPEYWSQPYYQTTEHWKGPGYPIFCIVAGEAHEDFGFIYPFVSEDLAKHFGAAAIQPEHRFYGTKKPVSNATKEQLLELLTVPQALADVARFTRHVATELGCNPHDKSSPKYCPIITVGGSYGGFLSTMSRMVYPDHVDIGYAGSGPILIYGQLVPDTRRFFDILTKAYDHASPGCADAVRRTLYSTRDTIMQVASETGSISKAAEAVGICGDLPEYIQSPEGLVDAIQDCFGNRFQ